MGGGELIDETSWMFDARYAVAKTWRLCVWNGSTRAERDASCTAASDEDFFEGHGNDAWSIFIKSGGNEAVPMMGCTLLKRRRKIADNERQSARP